MKGLWKSRVASPLRSLLTSLSSARFLWSRFYVRCFHANKMYYTSALVSAVVCKAWCQITWSETLEIETHKPNLIAAFASVHFWWHWTRLSSSATWFTPRIPLCKSFCESKTKSKAEVQERPPRQSSIQSKLESNKRHGWTQTRCRIKDTDHSSNPG